MRQKFDLNTGFILYTILRQALDWTWLYTVEFKEPFIKFEFDLKGFFFL